MANIGNGFLCSGCSVQRESVPYRFTAQEAWEEETGIRGDVFYFCPECGESAEMSGDYYPVNEPLRISLDRW